MASPLLADASDLDLWASRRDAQAALPDLVRRLIHATQDPVRLEGFRAGEGVQVPGWDGIVEVQDGSAFVPGGVSAWELSVERGVKAKADADYAKRTSEPQGVDPSRTVFAFLTPRRWRGKQKWVDERREDGKWRNVRVYDADDLEQWLIAAPAVHYWLSRRLGKHPEGAEDLDTCWSNWAAATKPEISPRMLLAGRQDFVDQTAKWLEDPRIPLALRASTRAEAIALFGACLRTMPIEFRDRLVSRAVLVRDRAAWTQLTFAQDHLLLVADFDCNSAALAEAARNEHWIIVPLGHCEPESPNQMNVPLLDPAALTKALVDAGVDEKRAMSLAAVARRSFTAFRRRISAEPELETPMWARPENARSLLPALLAGRWSSEVDADREALATLGERPFSELNGDFVRWSNEDDPPVRCIGTTWYLTSEEDAWSLLGRFLTRDDLARFQALAVKTLRQPDPAFDLPEDKRWAAGIFGSRPTHSNVLREGIANTLAILGARGIDLKITGGMTLESFSKYPVAQLLTSDDWKAWASLPLELLAEGAPDEFLSAVERGATGSAPFLLDLFQDEDAGFMSSPPHTSLLWALEILAWSPQYVSRSTLALAMLARLDPGGRWANRPSDSLRRIFLPWLPRTTATVGTRFKAIDLIRKREPEAAWRLLISLLPHGTGHTHQTALPRWRDWAPESDPQISPLEYTRVIRAIVDRLLEDADWSGERWQDLVRWMAHLPADLYHRVLAGLESVDFSAADPREGAIVWNAIRQLVSRHRSFAQADWALPAEELERLAAAAGRLEPANPLMLYGWLFDNSPSLFEGREEDWQSYWRMVGEHQCQAVETMHDKSGLAWLPVFIEKVERPDNLGAAIARSAIAETVVDDLLRGHLAGGERDQAFVAGLVGTMVQKRGIDWAIGKLNTAGLEWTPAKKAAICLCLPFNSPTWDLVDGIDETTWSEYWQKVTPFSIERDQAERAIRRLMDYGRHDVAVDLAQDHIRKGRLPAALIAEILEGLLRLPVDDTPRRRLSPGVVADMMRFLAQSSEIDQSRIAAIEWGFLPALGPHEHAPKTLFREMARSPEFFAQVVALSYRAEGEESHGATADDKARAERAWHLLEQWRGNPMPGMSEDESLDAGRLRSWVLDARNILKAQGRLAIGDVVLGQVLSGPRFGEDGAWPHPAIRDLIEELASDEFEQGLCVGHMNGQGISYQDPNNAAGRDRRKAGDFDGFAAKVADQWPRTAAFLRCIGDSYRDSARRQDEHMEIRQIL